LLLLLLSLIAILSNFKQLLFIIGSLVWFGTWYYARIREGRVKEA
jgi:hypothetical protein